jgi:superfamily II DNA or RNA helicase
MHEVLRATQWEKRRAIAWLPTGTGKTRVTVETALLQCVLEAPRNCILWIADREELCEQAVETFRHVWMVRGLESRVARGGTVPPLRIIRLWGNRDWQEPPAHPTVIVASIQTLATRLKGDASGAFAEELAILGERAAVVIFDEAHHVVAPSYAKVIDALGLGPRPNYLGRNQKTAPPLLGLTATPARRHDDETEVLSRRFGGTLLEPSARYRSLKGYQDEGFLSRVVYKSIPTDYDLELSRTEREQFDLFHSLPSSVLKRIGAVTTRTTRILRDLERRLAHFKAVLVFACSVDHAHMMAEVLSRRGHRAAALDGTTARPLRWRTIQRFREGALRVLVNCDLLTTGFDAPNVEAVVLARPVESPVLYAQMIGRGLRGPKNGGTEECHIFDYQDRFVELPDLNDLRERFRSNFLATSR